MTRVLAAVAALLLASGPVVAGPADSGPVVLELFTSQSCSSCPPADALLGRLRAQEGSAVLPLSLHVDYWNRIGWVDPFSSRDLTKRQYAYSNALGDQGVYTPQLVVDGGEGVVGSDASAVARAISRARELRAAQAAPALAVAREAGQVTVRVGAGTGRGRVLLVGYDDRHVTAVPSGENAGSTLTEYNVVRGLVPLGPWYGAEATFHAALPPGEHAAVLLQGEDLRMLAARVAG